MSTSPGRCAASFGKARRIAAGKALARYARPRHGVCLAAEQVGGAQRCLDLAVAYAKEREQFGRPIGSFQAIKHKCADMMVKVESARSPRPTTPAAPPPRSNEELPVVASIAQAAASEAYFECAGDAIQIFGGVGFHLGVRHPALLQAGAVERRVPGRRLLPPRNRCPSASVSGIPRER